MPPKKKKFNKPKTDERELQEFREHIKIIKKRPSFKQFKIKGLQVPVTSPTTGRTDLRTVNTKKRVTKKRPFTGPRTAKGQPILKKDIKLIQEKAVASINKHR